MSKPKSGERIPTQVPSQSPKILDNDVDFLKRCVEKWMTFQTRLWSHTNKNLGRQIRTNTLAGNVFRVLIIFLSAAVTTISNIDEIWREAVTVMAGTLTFITGMEAYFNWNQRRALQVKMQQEIDALRDELRYAWFVDVETEGDMPRRLKRAKDLLEEGPRRYNEILSKYIEEEEGSDSPTVNT